MQAEAISTRAESADRAAEPTAIDHLLVESQVRSVLNCGHSTYWKLIADGALKTVTVGRRRYVRESDLRAFIAGLS